jgi:hypothetical protein
MPKAVVATLEEIPQALRSEYEPRDGKFVLKVEGDLPGYVAEGVVAQQRTKLDEMRENNRTLMRELGSDTIEAAVERAKLYRDFTPEQLRKLKTVDPDEYVRLKTAHDQMAGKGVTNPDDIDAKISAALQANNREVVMPLKAQVEAADKRREEAERQLEESTFSRELTAAAINPKVGARADAIDFLLEKAKADFHVKDGKVVAKADKFSPATGLPLSLDEWFATAAKKYAFAFEASGGGGAAGSGNGSGQPVRHGRELVFGAGPADPRELARLANDPGFLKGETKIVHRGS